MASSTGAQRRRALCDRIERGPHMVCADDTPRLFIRASGFDVTAVVGYWHRPSPLAPTDPAETQRVFSVPRVDARLAYRKGQRVVFKLMFVSPRIAPNTGNAIRTAAATGCELHLVEPLGFDLSEPKLRRAGLDYHDLASVTVHASLQAAWDVLAPTRVVAFTAHATTLFADIDYQAGDVLMFGPEPTGLDAVTLADAHVTHRVRIPMLAGRRSLNLSNAAAVAVYEAWRQHGFTGAV